MGRGVSLDISVNSSDQEGLLPRMTVYWKHPYILFVNLAYRTRPSCIEIHAFIVFGSFWLLVSGTY